MCHESSTLAWDKSAVSTHQSIYPVYAVAHALPLAEKRKRRSFCLLAYFSKVPHEARLELSKGKQTEAARALHTTQRLGTLPGSLRAGLTCHIPN